MSIVFYSSDLFLSDYSYIELPVLQPGGDEDELDFSDFDFDMDDLDLPDFNTDDLPTSPGSASTY